MVGVEAKAVIVGVAVPALTADSLAGAEGGGVIVGTTTPVLPGVSLVPSAQDNASSSANANPKLRTLRALPVPIETKTLNNASSQVFPTVFITRIVRYRFARPQIVDNRCDFIANLRPAGFDGD